MEDHWVLKLYTKLGWEVSKTHRKLLVADMKNRHEKSEIGERYRNNGGRQRARGMIIKMHIAFIDSLQIEIAE